MAIILPMAALPVALGVVYSKGAIVCGTLAFVFAVLIACTHFSIIKAARRQIFVVRRPKKNGFAETN